jgi:hypothetical protein
MIQTKWRSTDALISYELYLMLAVEIQTFACRRLATRVVNSMQKEHHYSGVLGDQPMTTWMTTIIIMMLLKVVRVLHWDLDVVPFVSVAAAHHRQQPPGTWFGRPRLYHAFPVFGWDCCYSA